jgi:hypothetical protein
MTCSNRAPLFFTKHIHSRESESEKMGGRKDLEGALGEMEGKGIKNLQILLSYTLSNVIYKHSY